MRISQAFPSDYLRAPDLQGQTVTVQMSHVEMKDFGTESKPILFFVGKERGLVLNKTNANTISQAYGDDTDSWAGHPVILYVVETEFQGRPTQGLRVRIPPRNHQAPAPAQTPVRPAAQQLAPAPVSGIDDSIPF